jgi:hypothetical protein
MCGPETNYEIKTFKCYDCGNLKTMDELHIVEGSKAVCDKCNKKRKRSEK